VKCREQAEREASPAAAIIDRKTREKRRKRGRASIRTAMTRGKKIKGKKRHVLVDPQGLLMGAFICSPTARIKGRSLPTRAPTFCLR